MCGGVQVLEPKDLDVLKKFAKGEQMSVAWRVHLIDFLPPEFPFVLLEKEGNVSVTHSKCKTRLRGVFDC